LRKEFFKHRNSNLSDEDKLKNFRKNKSRGKARVVSSIKRKEFTEKKGYLKAKNNGNF